jgi:hypothetical protein
VLLRGIKKSALADKLLFDFNDVAGRIGLARNWQ